MNLYRMIFAFISIFSALFAKDLDVRIGKLDNGLTYYVMHNQFPKEKASLRLIVNVGSIYETEEERGLAHFVEHMVFRGSEHFSDWEIIRYLESIGAEFGADTNACTSFEETVYMLQVPLEKEESLKKAILILSDFAGRATFQEELIEKERTVVMDEFHLSQKQSTARLYNQVYAEFFKNSAYHNRMPIGIKEVILHCDPNTIRNFYKKWYRPNRMAVVAVGDFDVESVEEQIKECFGDLLSGDNTTISTDVGFPCDVKSLILNDEEESFLQGGFAQFYTAVCPHVANEEGIRNNLIHSLMVSIINQRLLEISKEHPAPFLWGGLFFQPFTQYHEALRLHYVGFMERPLDGLRVICKEIERFKQFGPTAGELEREVSQMSEALATAITNIDRIENDVFVENCMNHFRCNIPLGSPEDVYLVKKKIISELTCDEIKNWLIFNINLQGMHRIFTMPQDQLLNQGEIDQILLELKDVELTPPKELSKEVINVQVSEHANIESVQHNSDIGFTTIILDNGMKAILHPTRLEKGVVQVNLIAPHGKTLFAPSDYGSLQLSTYYLIESGLANLSGAELKSFLHRTNSKVSPAIGSDTRSITASAPTNESESLFQAIRAMFFEKRFDPSIWNSVVEMCLEIEKYQMNQPDVYFSEQVNQEVFENHPFFVPVSVKDASEEVARKCAEFAFSDPRDFSIVVTGDFDVDEIKSLIIKYFYVPDAVKKGSKESIIPILSSEVVTKDQIIYRGKESHGSTMIVFRKNYSVN